MIISNVNELALAIVSSSSPELSIEDKNQNCTKIRLRLSRLITNLLLMPKIRKERTILKL